MDRARYPGQPRAARASCCPGCGLAIRFGRDELGYDGPEVQEVMCAFCGTTTRRDRLLAEAFDLGA
jgi:hypothetical protein